jgi:hypothetical protein
VDRRSSPTRSVRRSIVTNFCILTDIFSFFFLLQYKTSKMLSDLSVVLVHPWGLEDAVASDIRRLLADFPDVDCHYELTKDASSSSSPLRGMQTLRVNFPATPFITVAQQLGPVVPFLDALHRNRLTEQVCLRLWATDCVESCSELDATFEAHKAETLHLVHTVLGTLRKLMISDAAASRDPTLSANTEFHETISDCMRALPRKTHLRTALSDGCQRRR